MLPNVVFRLVPIPRTTVMIATEIPAAIKPYSIAVAPVSSLRNRASASRMFQPLVALPPFPLGLLYVICSTHVNVRRNFLMIGNATNLQPVWPNLKMFLGGPFWNEHWPLL